MKSLLINWNVLMLAFTTLFIAEMGDKTQLAVFTLVTESKAPLSVFLGASLALAVVTLIGVIFGGVITKVIPTNYLKIGAGFLFCGIGGYTLWEAFSGIINKL
ncbi:MAG TPA: TMEM165/GDT1 family protein [Bacillota bacterium]|jgi:putative Ca2+/H+ antiporter (TMEM165/GDT1 family)|nr:TMEM165/GDT1 family protein [Bacillota bacterium]HOL09094.1 TMEM165/GDT1 family protein [Bacillota bacterium]HPO98028.1 TMEM165/GDT1 family protein [Bacillota bacterium]